MLQFITDAPRFVLRELEAFMRATLWADAPVDSPAWAEAVLTIVSDAEAVQVLGYLRSAGHRVEAWRPRERRAYGDPTFAMAAASIERGGSSSAPAAAYVR